LSTAIRYATKLARYRQRRPVAISSLQFPFVHGG